MSQNPPLFDNVKVTELVERYKLCDPHDRDPAILGDILSETRVLIEVIASRYDMGVVLKDDLIQEARLKVITRVCEYDPERGTKLYSFLSVVIRNAMIDYIRKHKPSIELDDMEDEEELSEGNYVVLLVEELRDWFRKRFPTLVATELAGEMLEFIIGSMVDSTHKKRNVLKELIEGYGMDRKQARVVYEAVLVKLRMMMSRAADHSKIKEESLLPELMEIVGEEDLEDTQNVFFGLSVKFEE